MSNQQVVTLQCTSESASATNSSLQQQHAMLSAKLRAPSVHIYVLLGEKQCMACAINLTKLNTIYNMVSASLQQYFTAHSTTSTTTTTSTIINNNDNYELTCLERLLSDNDGIQALYNTLISSTSNNLITMVFLQECTYPKVNRRVGGASALRFVRLQREQQLNYIYDMLFQHKEAMQQLHCLQCWNVKNVSFFGKHTQKLLRSLLEVQEQQQQTPTVVTNTSITSLPLSTLEQLRQERMRKQLQVYDTWCHSLQGSKQLTSSYTEPLNVDHQLLYNRAIPAMVIHALLVQLGLPISAKKK